MIVVEHVYLDGTEVTEEIIGRGQAGTVVKRGGHAVKIPKITKFLEIDRVPHDSGRLTPDEEGGYDRRPPVIETLQNEKAVYRRSGNDCPGIMQCFNASSTDCSLQMPLMQDDLRHFLAETPREGKAAILVD